MRSNYFKNIKLDHRIPCILLLIIFICFDIYQYCEIRIGPDSGYYLSVPRDMVNLGRLPIVDTYSIYTPLGYLFYAIPFVLYHGTPPICVFLILNLILFVFTSLIFLNTLKKLLKNDFLIISIFFIYIYVFHLITYDIKLENIVLFLNIVIINILNKFRLNNNVKSLTLHGNCSKFILLGIFCALAILTKQFAGLTLIYIFLFLYIHFGKHATKGMMLVLFSFLLILSFYFLFLISQGQTIQYSISQFKGELVMDCFKMSSGGGKVYGERNLNNLLFGFKYYKLNLLIYWFLFLVVFTKLKGIKLITFRKISFMFIVFLLAQVPFYFQVFPHYVPFGLPFIFYFLIVIFSEAEENIVWPNLSIQSSVVFGLMISLTCYTFINQYIARNKIILVNGAKETFYANINREIPIGSKVFMFNNRSLWYTCNFVTPVPTTLGYGFVSRDCFKLSVLSEKPKSFWVADIHPIGNDYQISGYKKIKNVQIHEADNKFFGVLFEKLIDN